MKTANVRIGIVGVGIMGERHCRVCADLRQVDLVGVADLDETRGQDVAARHGTAHYFDYRKLLPELDAVVVATPTDSHFDVAETCLKQGLHVLVEKPIASTVEQAERLVRVAEREGLILQVGHIERFNPAYVELKRQLVGAMPPVGIIIRRLSPLGTSNVGVDVVRDLMIHDLDLAADLTGQTIVGLSAWGRSADAGEVDYAVATLSLRNGTVATLFASRIAEQKVRTIEIIAEGIYIEADLLNKSILVHCPVSPQYYSDGAWHQKSLIERIHAPTVEPLMMELRHFTDCVRQNCPSQVPGSDGVRALRSAEAVIGAIGRRHIQYTLERSP